MPTWDLVSCASQKWPMRFLCSHRNSWIPLGHGASQVVLVVENLPANAGDIREVGTIPGSGRSPGGGHGNPLQYSCLENPMDRGAWRAIVHSAAKSWRRLKWLGMHTRLGHGHYSPWQRGPQAPGWGSSPCQQSLPKSHSAAGWAAASEVGPACVPALSCLTLCDLMDCNLPGLQNPWNSPGKNTGVGCHFLLQGIIPTQGLNWNPLCLLHCRQILYYWAIVEALGSTDPAPNRPWL